MRTIKAKFDAWRSQIEGMGFKLSRRGVSRLHQRPAWGVVGIFAFMPRWIGTAGALGFLGLSAGYGIVLGGHVQSVSESITTAAGFGIEEIDMNGLQRVEKFQVLENLELSANPSLVLFDAAAARERLQKIAWVKDVSIQKFYPGTLKVIVEEQVPYALWQRGDVISVITKDGRVITDEVDGRYANLLRVVNHGAQYRVDEIKKALDAYPALRGRVRAAKLRSERRWDLNLENGIVVRLPENDLDGALQTLLRLDEEGGLLSRDIVAVDLRLEDRVVVRLSDDAALRRKATSKTRKSRPRRLYKGAET